MIPKNSKEEAEELKITPPEKSGLLPNPATQELGCGRLYKVPTAHLYATDDLMGDHSRRSKPENCPLLHKFVAMDMDERWVNRSPTMMRHAVWLLPSPEFRHATIERRGGWTSGFLAKTSNPERALQNLLERDRMFTDRLRKEVEVLGLRAIQVNTAIVEEYSASLVTEIFGL